MKLNQQVINLLSEKTGINVDSLAGADFLRNDIESKLGERLSLNTIKRLVGLLPYDSHPRESTLEIIAHYLGFSSWQILSDTFNDKISEFNVGNGFIDLKELPLDILIKIEWEPDRKLVIKHLREGDYQVVFSENSKLKIGDILLLSQIGVGFPFIVKEVIRKGNSLGNYTSASLEGISKVEIIDG